VCERKRENLPRSSFFCGEEEKRKSKKKRKQPSFSGRNASPRIERLIVRYLGTLQNKKKGKKYARARRGEANLSLSLSLSVRERSALIKKMRVFLLQMSKTKMSFISSAKLSSSFSLSFSAPRVFYHNKSSFLLECLSLSFLSKKFYCFVRVSLFCSKIILLFLRAALKVSLAQIRRSRERTGESFEFKVLVFALLIVARTANLAFLGGGWRRRRRRLAFR